MMHKVPLLCVKESAHVITREQIPAVLDHPVCDTDGNKIGEAKHVFLDDTTGQPEWVSVKTGLFGTSESFVPIQDATVVEDHLEVPFAKDEIKDAANVDADSGGHLSEDEEHRVYAHYGIDGDAAGTRRISPAPAAGPAPTTAAGQTWTPPVTP